MGNCFSCALHLGIPHCEKEGAIGNNAIPSYGRSSNTIDDDNIIYAQRKHECKTTGHVDRGIFVPSRRIFLGTCNPQSRANGDNRWRIWRHEEVSILR